MHFLQEPIQRKVFFLVMVFITALVIVIGAGEFPGHVPFEKARTIENQWSRRFLGKVILEGLASVERDARALAAGDEPGDPPLHLERLRASIRDMEHALDVLRKGGRYEKSVAVDVPDADPLMKTIVHRRDDEGGGRMGVNDLAAGLKEIETLSETMGTTAGEKLRRPAAHAPTASEAASGALRKRMDAVFQRCREAARETVHDAGLEIQRLEEKRGETVHTRKALRYFTAIAAAVVGLALFLRAAGHVSRILANRRRALEEARERNRRTTFILDAAKIGIAVFDRDHGIRSVDPFIEKTRGPAAARKCFEHLMEREEVCPDCPTGKAFRTGEAVVCETSFAMFENRPVQRTAIPFRTDEGEMLCAMVYVDVTERERAEKAILREKEKAGALNVSLEQSIKRTRRLAREAEAAHIARSEFLTRVNHEIRRPMNGVIGLLNLLEETTPDHERKEGLALASTSVESLLTILGRTLDLSRIEAAAPDLQAWSLDLETAVTRSKGVLAAGTDEGMERTDDAVVTCRDLEPPPRDEEERTMDEPERESAGSYIFAFDEAVARYDGDAELLRGIIQSFLEDAPRLIKEIEADIAAGHPGRIGKNAHSLKGGASYIGAARLRDAAFDMEKAGKSDDLSLTATLLPGLWSEFERFNTEFRVHPWDRGWMEGDE